MAEIIIIGLGPGDLKYITLETWNIIKNCQALFLRTAKHPCVKELDQEGVKYQSYDFAYERYATFEEVYSFIAADCIRKANEYGQMVFAVPGSPLVAEKTVELIRQLAAEENVKVTIIPGMSFLEVLYTRLGVDPINGITVIDAADLAQLPADNPTSLIVTQLYNQQVASDAKLTLMEYLSDEYEVILIRNLGLADEYIQTLPLYEIDRVPGINHLTSLYVPANRQEPFSLEKITDVMEKLRSPNGCPWDIEQTHPSLRRYLVEEVYEVLEAIDNKDMDGLCEELGDLLLQIVFHARIAEESGLFTMQDVIDTVTEKMIRRHPHVFGSITVKDAAEVVVNWDAIKKVEKAGERTSVLDGISVGLPALMRAYKLQAKAAKKGFDWKEITPVWDKVFEELQELKQADSMVNREEELGDLLFAVVNLARFLGVEPETALNKANNKFRSRFLYVEKSVQASTKHWQEFSLKELDVFWEKAKRLEKY